MRWTQRVTENIKRGVRSWLNIQETNPTNITITEVLDYEANAIKNRIWYRGDSDELQQLYSQINTGVDKYKFWACKSTPGMEIRKIHTGLPALIVDTIANVTLADVEIQIDKSQEYQDLWDAIDEKNGFRKKLEKAVKETLYIGDGAFKISFDENLSKYPIIEFYPGDRVELVMNRGMIREIVFKTSYKHNRREYVLYEHYGYGTITYELYENGRQVDIKSIPETENLVPVAFGPENPEEKYMIAVPIKFFESGKWDGRGQSVYDKKVDAFDAFDETWSQWMDAQRAGRAKEYIPESLIPRDSNGNMLSPNHFDNRFIAVGNDMSENAQNKIDVEQPAIPHESYIAAYTTALDLCLQGLISPSTLGIDVKKLDNADAQREKEKATLYTRDAIINALQVDIPLLVETILKAHNEYHHESVEPIEVKTEFGDYANPSFESQVETLGKARAEKLMSVDAAVDELYGDDKDEDWKKEEIARIKGEIGIATMEEPGVWKSAGEFEMRMEGDTSEGKGDQKNVQNEPKGVPGAS